MTFIKKDKNTKKFFLVIVSLFVIFFSWCNKKDFVAVDSVELLHFESSEMELIKKDIGFDKPDDLLHVQSFYGEYIPKLNQCRLDSAGFVREVQQAYAFVTCHDGKEMIPYFAVVVENDHYRVGLFEKMSKYITHPKILVSVILFCIVLFLMIFFGLKIKGDKFFRICLLVDVYVLIMQSLIHFCPNSFFNGIWGLFQFPVNMALFFLELQIKLPLWYSVLQFTSLLCMYVLLYYGIQKLKKRKRE